MQVAKVPLLSISLTKPSDGLPLYQSWVNVASDVYYSGYESWRGVIEVKAFESPGSQLDFHSLQATKGLGRLSVIYFGILRTYLKHQHDLTDEQIKDLKRLDH